jgi:EAL domain-containing protein (putative c-di-GMP-specific phosphodiesterase class I)
MIRTIVGLAAALGVEVIAEGIEARAQADQLMRLGCLRGQGYFFSQPVRASVASEMFSAPSLPLQA